MVMTPTKPVPESFARNAIGFTFGFCAGTAGAAWHWPPFASAFAGVVVAVAAWFTTALFYRHARRRGVDV